MDDTVLTGDNLGEMKALQEYLATKFEMKDLDKLKYFLKIKVSRSKYRNSLSQIKYMLDLITETTMLVCKPVEMPEEMNHKLGENLDQVPMDKGRYQRLAGRLICLSHTRPNIAYAVSIVTRFLHVLSEEHICVVYQILRYLRNVPGKKFSIFQ